MKIQFGNIKKVNLREIWNNEAMDFTPWLASHIGTLGELLVWNSSLRLAKLPWRFSVTTHGMKRKQNASPFLAL
jgi:hypothetical protein